MPLTDFAYSRRHRRHPHGSEGTLAIIVGSSSPSHRYPAPTSSLPRLSIAGVSDRWSDSRAQCRRHRRRAAGPHLPRVAAPAIASTAPGAPPLPRAPKRPAAEWKGITVRRLTPRRACSSARSPRRGIARSPAPPDLPRRRLWELRPRSEPDVARLDRSSVRCSSSRTRLSRRAYPRVRARRSTLARLTIDPRRDLRHAGDAHVHVNPRSTRPTRRGALTSRKFSRRRPSSSRPSAARSPASTATAAFGRRCSAAYAGRCPRALRARESAPSTRSAIFKPGVRCPRRSGTLTEIKYDPRWRAAAERRRCIAKVERERAYAMLRLDLLGDEPRPLPGAASPL